MIRIAQDDGWILVAHRDHARLAGRLAERWGNVAFARPGPFADVLTAVAHHDDAWAEHDAAPCVTADGQPGAFSKELVGSYRAFEAIDLADYLRVRGSATETVATTNPYAAIVISMHTVNLLTEQMDRRTLDESQGALLARFIDDQLRRQAELAAQVARDPARADDVESPRLRRAFEFLQACDSLSLVMCVDYPRPIPLRHRHSRRDGSRVTLECTPLGGRAYRVEPWPFDQAGISGSVPCRRVIGRTFASDAAFRAACDAAPMSELKFTIVP